MYFFFLLKELKWISYNPFPCRSRCLVLGRKSFENVFQNTRWLRRPVEGRKGGMRRREGGWIEGSKGLRRAKLSYEIHNQQVHVRWLMTRTKRQMQMQLLNNAAAGVTAKE